MTAREGSIWACAFGALIKRKVEALLWAVLHQAEAWTCAREIS